MCNFKVRAVWLFKSLVNLEESIRFLLGSKYSKVDIYLALMNTARLKSVTKSSMEILSFKKEESFVYQCSVCHRLAEVTRV